MGKSKHAPNRLRAYIEIHDSFISQYVDKRFIGFNTLRFIDSPDKVFVRGHLGCSGNIVIAVEKKLVFVDRDHRDDLVQTQWYAYNVFVQNVGNVFRYDNQDKDFAFRKGHKDPHHKHLFDWRTNKELQAVWVGVDGWPTLGEVIEEAHQWYWDNHSALRLGYPSKENLHLNL
jgi:hypothetical protein